MSTRSLIGRLINKDEVEYIYCHFDGYPSHHLPILTTHYNNEEIVKELIAGGGLSVLKENINPPDGVSHSYDNKTEGVCVYYHRDRNEIKEGPYKVNKTTYKTELFRKSSGVDYIYLYDPKKGWKVCKR